MKQYKIVVAYDGTNYAGWIQQKNQPTIVQTLQSTFFHVFKKHITILGASKTDAGVHALGQIAIFKVNIAINTQKMRWAWNNALPYAITIRSLLQDDTFHPHYNVAMKTYYYHIFLQRPLPFYSRYGMHIPYAIDINKFNQMLQLFKGTHDFSAFYTGKDRVDSIRTIESIKMIFIRRYNVYRVIIRGEKFLRHMVRRIIGAAIAAASRTSITDVNIKKALETKNIDYELPTAPAQGLMLAKILYKETPHSTFSGR